MRRKDDEKAQRIKQAVIRVVLEEGFGDASISKIAKCAGVSQATVYIYYDSKESMLRSIYLDCAEELWDYLLLSTEGLHDGREILRRLIGGYYSFMRENETLFRFIEQYGSCPALTSNCTEIRGISRMVSRLQQWQMEGIFQPYSLLNIFSMIFTPVKMLTAGAIACQAEEEDLLQELIGMIQKLLLF